MSFFAELWKEQVQLKNIELQKESEVALEKKGILKNYDYNAIYDCDNRAMLQQMLTDAIHHMKQNPKFVLASMPKAYNLTPLREFVYRRFGKVYTREELLREFRRSLEIFKALDKVSLPVKVPNIKDIGQKLLINYRCRDDAMKKVSIAKTVWYAGT